MNARTISFALAGAIALGAAAGCGGAAAPVSTIRFANADPVWLVNDRKDVVTTPAERPDVENLRAFDIAVYRRLTRILEARPRRRALGTNSLGEVPTSTWFENRIGVRDVTLAEIARGPGASKPPDLSKPLQIVRGKTTGATAGFTVEDAAGDRWIAKFEFPDHPVAESATDIVVQRLLWMAGYNVTENHIIYVTRDQMVLADDAKIKDARGRSRRMTAADVEAILARTAPWPDGRYRVLASKFLAGKPIGAPPQEGVRKDDPNDTIPHERRRELRGLKLFAGWLQHTDFKEMGYIDVWQDDPVHEGRKVVVHYMVDFGNSLGVFGRWGHRNEDGHAEILDSQYAVSLFTFGLWKRPWEGVPSPDIRGVGAFDVEHFDPDGFTPFSPWTPFIDADDLDMFWALKILMRITPAHIRAALEAGQYDDPRAIDYLLGVLTGRQQKAARIYLDRVAPIDELAVSESGGAVSLCFADLRVRYGVGEVATYHATSFDAAARPLAAAVAARADGDRVCATIPVTTGADGYTIVRLDATQGRKRWPPVDVHLARAAGARALRVVGIERALPGER
jgi:hypothetical protein